MGGKKKQHNHNISQSYPADVDSDYAAAAHEQQLANMLDGITPARPQTVSEMNLAVLRKHNSRIAAIVDIAQYAVIYVFQNSTSSWEKSGTEGSLFIVELSSPPGYGVVILNRRGLDNFEVELTTTESVEVTDSYIILTDGPDDAPKVYGVWVFSEPSPSSTSGKREQIGQMILECASAVEHSGVETLDPTSTHTGRQAAIDHHQQPRQEQPQQRSKQASPQEEHSRSLMALLTSGSNSSRHPSAQQPGSDQPQSQAPLLQQQQQQHYDGQPPPPQPQKQFHLEGIQSAPHFHNIHQQEPSLQHPQPQQPLQSPQSLLQNQSAYSQQPYPTAPFQQQPYPPQQPQHLALVQNNRAQHSGSTIDSPFSQARTDSHHPQHAGFNAPPQYYQSFPFRQQQHHMPPFLQQHPQSQQKGSSQPFQSQIPPHL